MYGVGEDSVAEASHKYANAVREGRLSDPGLLFDHREAPAGFDFGDDDELRAALAYVYGDASVWIDLERLVAEARDPQTDEAQFRRFFLNQPTARSDSFPRPPSSSSRASSSGQRTAASGRRRSPSARPASCATRTTSSAITARTVT